MLKWPLMIHWRVIIYGGERRCSRPPTKEYDLVACAKRLPPRTASARQSCARRQQPGHVRLVRVRPQNFRSHLNLKGLL